MLDVVVVNWNAGEQLKACVDSLSGAFQITVVDNGSTDRSIDEIDGMLNVTAILVGENIGFGRACNLGAHRGHGDFLLFLNPDASVFPGTIERSLEYMRAPDRARVGICGVQLVDEHGHVSRSCARFPTPWHFLSHSIALDRLFPSLGHFMFEWPHDETREVDQVMGAFFLVRRSLFESLGGFDERFFVYFEEVDFSKRAHDAGWASVYLADVKAFHGGGGTSSQVPARRLFYSLRSRLLYADKHFSLAGLAITCVSTLLIEPLSRTVLALARRSWSACRETWSAYAMLWRWIPQRVLKGVAR